MPTTRPGFIWSGTEWVAIGQEAVVAPVSYQATAPTSPATGDIWIESDVDVPSIDSAQFLRWRKTMTGGETSLSGNDDSSLPLAYTPGYEQLYINGVLQVRGGDYTATTGTTVTGLTALVANDVVEIFSAVARTVADVYTQTQSDARFVNRNVGGLTQIIPTSVTGGTLGANGQITFSGSSSVSIDGAFTSSYENYKIVGNFITSTAAYMQFRFRTGGATRATGYRQTEQQSAQFGATEIRFAYSYANAGNYTPFEQLVSSPAVASIKSSLSGVMIGQGDSTGFTFNQASFYNTAEAHDGFLLLPGSGTFTGTIRIYGYNNGA
jgi:hypothetical protein